MCNGKIDPKAIEAASEFLSHPESRHRKEGNVQSDLEALLRAFEVGTLESHYSTRDGEADIYLPNRQTIIEVKAYPLAETPDKPQQGKSSESPRMQLNRYITSEIDRELTITPPDDEGFVHDDWHGILTDGRNWHVYKYPHRWGSEGREYCPPKRFTNEAKSLAEFLHSLLAARSIGKNWIPGDPGYLFVSMKEQLDELYQELPEAARNTTATKFSLWHDMMKTSGMVPNDEEGQKRLFVAHSFLIATVRFVSHSLFSSQEERNLDFALRDGFASWVLDFTRGRKWAEELFEMVKNYDWRRREEDVLRSLYHHIVHKLDRKLFGEFYTPDWLAGLMVEEVLDDEWIDRAINAALYAMRDGGSVRGIGVLDPTCGSGTFLYHAAQRLLSAPGMEKLPSVKKADIVTQLVNGMDIHPVAVELARINLERTLPAPPSEGASAYRIHLGDSLQSDSDRTGLFSHTEEHLQLTTPQGRGVKEPMFLVKSSRFADDMRLMVDSAEAGKPLPEFLTNSMNECATQELRECHRALGDIIREEGNSVWTWYAINVSAPYLLELRKIDRVVANLPWVKLSDIQVEERRKKMESFGDKLGVRAKGKQAPHSDIASCFILATRKLYMSNPESDPASWLVKKSAIQSGQWELFRNEHSDTLRQSVDLEALQPFGGGDATRSCLLMEHRPMREFDNSGAGQLEAQLKNGTNRPRQHDALKSAQAMFQFKAVPKPPPQVESEYLNRHAIRQGATLVPHVLALIAEAGEPDSENCVTITTQRAKHEPWKQVRCQTGSIPLNWVRPMLTSKQMMPYIPVLRQIKAIVPIEENGEIHPDPGTACSFWRELNEIYGHRAGIGKATPKVLLQRFDYQSMLSIQLKDSKSSGWRVLYPTSGDIMRSARLPAGESVADSTLFWFAVATQEEAGYLVALLNASCLRNAFKHCRDSGRHFNLNPCRRVPIPLYDKQDKQHHLLAELCTQAEDIAQEISKNKLSEQIDISQIKLSKLIREGLQASETGQEIERIVTELLPEQTTNNHIDTS